MQKFVENNGGQKNKCTLKLKRILCLFKKIKKCTHIEDEFNKIKNDIIYSKLMFKNVQISQI